MLERVRVLQNAGERVIIARGNRIELVVVAAGAADRLRQNALADDVELLVHHVHLELLFVLLFEVRIRKREKRGGGQLTATLGERRVRQQIASDLFADETVERPVGIEGFDDVIAVTPRLFENETAQRHRLGVASDVEPMAAPTLAEMRRGEQSIHQPRVSVGRLVVDELIDLLRCRRQAGEVEIDAANQRSAVGVGRGLEILRLNRRQDEAVNIAARPRCIFEARSGDRFHRLVGPELPPFLDTHADFLGRDRRGDAARIGRAELHPFLERGKLIRRELALGRHLQIGIGVTHGADEQALRRFAGHDGRTALAAFGPAFARVEAQTAFGLLLAVAFETLLGQQRTDLLLEKLKPFARRLGSRQMREAGGQGQEAGDETPMHIGPD